MKAGSRLLRKICATSLDVPFELYRREPKILHMSGLPPGQVFLRNLHKNTFVPETLASTYLSLVTPTANHTTCPNFHREVMEPFLEAYYNSGGRCEIPLTLPSENLPCQSSQESSALGSDSYAEDSLALQGKYLRDRQRYKAMRQWKRFRKEKLASNLEDFFILRLLSFNILAQHLLESYPYLYNRHDPEALPWEVRKPLLQQEILEAHANVVCLQEMQEDHLQEFLIPFKELNYNYLYKKRTNDKRDGLLFLYRADQFVLLEHTKVELYQSGIELLSRDNVGIVAKLAVKDNPEIQFVIATTHLLYNPKRNDVRLGQTQLLLAEIERIAYLENTMTGPRYLPIILSGDFNLEPYSGVYKFVTEGVFEYRGKGKNLEQGEYRSLSNSLIPSRLCITDNCQHFNILTKRLRGEGIGKVMLENSEYCDPEESSANNHSSKHCEVNADTTDSQMIEVARGCRAKFSSGTLTHPFNLHSIYKHYNHQGEREATTNQGTWITVDYIFYSDLEPLEVYTLPTIAECATLRTIPNFCVGSDHLCLGATFKVFKRTC